MPNDRLPMYKDVALPGLLTLLRVPGSSVSHHAIAKLPDFGFVEGIGDIDHQVAQGLDLTHILDFDLSSKFGYHKIFLFHARQAGEGDIDTSSVCIQTQHVESFLVF